MEFWQGPGFSFNLFVLMKYHHNTREDEGGAWNGG
jgi:hypothetical protein